MTTTATAQQRATPTSRSNQQARYSDTDHHIRPSSNLASSFTPVTKPRSLHPIKAYLLLYNLISCCGWAWILEKIISDILWNGGLPGSMTEIINRSTKMQPKIGTQLNLIQSLAILEVAHSLLRLVRSNVSTSMMQVASRLCIVWLTLPRFPTLGQNPIFSSMVFAWSFTEVIRYAHYATGLLELKINILEWLRYSTFYVLYPIGAGSEAILMYYASQSAKQNQQNLLSKFILALVMIWPPCLYTMMSHMVQQRKRYTQRTKKQA